jgi:hypothetical protein
MNPFALLSVVFMMSFVMLFDKAHWRKIQARLRMIDLFSQDEMENLLKIMAACQES